MIQQRPSIIVIAIFLLSLAGAPELLGAPTYVVTELPELNGGGSRAIGINDLGEVTGLAAFGTGPIKEAHAVKWQGGEAFDLSADGTQCVGAAINSRGDVAGWSQDLRPKKASPLRLGVIWRDGVPKSIGTLGGNVSDLTAINQSGEAVGRSRTSDHGLRACVYSGGTLKELGTLAGGRSDATGIANSGVIVGAALDKQGAPHAVEWEHGRIHDLGTLGGPESYARAITRNGLVAGEAGTAFTRTHAVLWHNGVITDLNIFGGAYNSAAYAANDAGQVVGDAYVEKQAQFRAFLYTDGTSYDLNDLIPADSGWVLTEARGIDSSGRIVGVGTRDGGIHAFLLAPVGHVLVTGLSPIAGATGSTVTITGTGFQSNPVRHVLFGRVAAKFTIVSDTEITAIAPPAVAMGAITVNNGVSSAVTVPFTVSTSAAMQP